MTAYTGWGASAPAGLTFQGDNSAYNLGQTFITSLSGQSCLGVRFYVPATATGSATGVIGSIYASYTGGYPTGSALATATFPTLSYGAWNSCTFSSAVSLTAGTSYALCVLNATGQSLYGDISGTFASADLPAPSGAAGLVFPQDTTAHHNGIFNIGATQVAPTSTFGSNYYGIDGNFDDGSGGALLPPDIVMARTRY